MPNISYIRRKSLLYKSEVDYGGWTINHVVGCMHGCKFPCYAFMMAKRFGWVKDYNDWRHPKIVKNALELLDKELKTKKEKINVVHLSFMTDPFMYDFDSGEIIPEVKEMTLRIIKKLNSYGIRVSTLTKGLYPKDLLSKDFSNNNEYGITLVSLNAKFKEEFEPFSSSYTERINSLKSLSKKGKRTWVSMEPYPTPNLDSNASQIEDVLEKISFVDKIIFGKLNYNVKSTKFENNNKFYSEMSKKVISFCNRNNIKYHIKTGTPGHKEGTEKVLREKVKV